VAGTIWTYNLITEDLDDLIAYVKANWGYGTTTMIPLPDEIWYDFGINYDHEDNKIRHCWMYKSCIKLTEGGTEHALLDMMGNADRINDTDITVLCYSKAGNKVVEGMFRRFIQLIQAKPWADGTNHYEFTQISSSQPPTRKRYVSKKIAIILLSRRGKGHA